MGRVARTLPIWVAAIALVPSMTGCSSHEESKTSYVTICLPTGARSWVRDTFKSAPSSCTMFAGPRYVAYKAYNLTKLKWKVWGGPRAEADGYYRPNSACGGPCPLQRVHVELAKPVRFWEGMLYTRFAVNGHWYRFFVRRGQGPIKALAVDPQNPQTVYALSLIHI